MFSIIITQKEEVNDSTNEYVLYAPSDGMVYFVTEVKGGMVTETRVKYKKITVK